MENETKTGEPSAEQPGLVASVQKIFSPRVVLFLLILVLAIAHNLIPSRFIPDPLNTLLISGALAILVLPKLRLIPKHMWAVVLLVAGVGIVYRAAPDKYHLDWPTIALLSGVVLLFFLPEFSRLPAYIERIKVNNSELVFNVKQLDNAVKEAEETPPTLGQTAGASVPTPNTRIEEDIIAIGSRDKRSALVRLALEIEKEVASLYEASGLKKAKPTENLRVMRRELRDYSIIPREVSNATREFWKVRDKVLHPEGGSPPIPEVALASTIDSGLRILRLLKEIPRDPAPSK
jgi:hypothetical protein